MNNKFLFFCFTLVLLNGCSEFYGYQPPAPIYGEGQRTNPYETRTTPTESIVTSDRKPFVKDIAEDKQTSSPYTAVNKVQSEKKVVIKRVAPPAILALVNEADRSSKTGDLESAVATIERALRIDSRNPALTYKLARLRLKQSKPRLAEDLAKKAALLAANDPQIKKQSWLLISEARKQQKNYYGAKEAKLKADSL